MPVALPQAWLSTSTEQEQTASPSTFPLLRRGRTGEHHGFPGARKGEKSPAEPLEQSPEPQVTRGRIDSAGWRQRGRPGSCPRRRERGRDVLPHLWDELEERVREQRADGERDEKQEHPAEKGLLGTRNDEDSEQGGHVNHGHTEKTKAPHCGTRRNEGQTLPRLSESPDPGRWERPAPGLLPALRMLQLRQNRHVWCREGGNEATGFLGKGFPQPAPAWEKPSCARGS